MKSKKLMEKIADWLDSGPKKKRHHRAELESLLMKLKEKETAVKEKLGKEKNKKKYKRLMNELSIVKAQQVKGARVLKGLEEK